MIKTPNLDKLHRSLLPAVQRYLTYRKSTGTTWQSLAIELRVSKNSIHRIMNCGGAGVSPESLLSVIFNAGGSVGMEVSIEHFSSHSLLEGKHKNVTQKENQ